MSRPTMSNLKQSSGTAPSTVQFLCVGGFLWNVAHSKRAGIQAFGGFGVTAQSGVKLLVISVKYLQLNPDRD